MQIRYQHTKPENLLPYQVEIEKIVLGFPLVNVHYLDVYHPLLLGWDSFYTFIIGYEHITLMVNGKKKIYKLTLNPHHLGITAQNVGWGIAYLETLGELATMLMLFPVEKKEDEECTD